MLSNFIVLFRKSFIMNKRNYADYNEFSKILAQAKHVVALTGAGISSESGLATFRGPGGLWRSFKSTDLASPVAFRSNPSLVWEFYHWRREAAFNAEPNSAHFALTKFEKMCEREGRHFNLITQNVDNLHQRSGSRKVIELHGSLTKVICTQCKKVDVNMERPICESLKGRGDPNSTDCSIIPTSELPKCKKCNSLVRPYIVWFGEHLDPDIMEASRILIQSCDLFLVIGTSSVVYPAASFAPFVVERGKPVAEFNLDHEPASPDFQFHFPGPCGITLPKALVG